MLSCFIENVTKIYQTRPVGLLATKWSEGMRWNKSQFYSICLLIDHMSTKVYDFTTLNTITISPYNTIATKFCSQQNFVRLKNVFTWRNVCAYSPTCDNNIGWVCAIKCFTGTIVHQYVRGPDEGWGYPDVSNVAIFRLVPS